MDENKVRILKDMLNADIAIGDVVLFPGGNARYGGLKMQVGLVVKLTPKRVGIATGALVSDGKKLKTSSKTGKTMLVCTDPKVLACEQVQALKQLQVKIQEEA